MTDELDDHSRPGAAFHIEDPAKKNTSDALRIVLAALATASGIHAMQPDTHSPSSDSLPSPRPIVGQPSEEYLNRRDTIFMPAVIQVPHKPKDEVVMQARVADQIYASHEDTSAEVAQTEPTVVYLPAVEKADNGPSMEAILSAEDSGSQEQAILNVEGDAPVDDQPAATATFSTPSQPTSQPTPIVEVTEQAEDQESVNELVQKLKEQTGISLILISDFLQPEEIGNYIAIDRSSADENIQGILAKTILDLPEKILHNAPENSKKIVIARNILESPSPISEGEVGYMIISQSNVKGEYKQVDVFDGPSFVDSEESILPSGLTPSQELRLATYHTFILDYIHSGAADEEIMTFFTDNLDFPLKNAHKLQDFYRRLGYVDVSDVPLDEILARLAAWRSIGRTDVIDAVSTLGVIDVSHLPSFQ